MRKRTGRNSAVALAAAALLCAAGLAQAAQIITGPCQSSTDPEAAAVSGCTIEPAANGTMRASLLTEGDEVAALQNDLVFPEDVAIAQQFEAVTTTTAAIGPKDTTIPLADASAFPDFGIIQIEGEEIAYGSKDGNNLLVADDSMVCNPAGTMPPDCTMDTDCTAPAICVPAGRGQNGTTAAAHASGSNVSLPADIPDCTMTEALAALNKSAVFSYLPSGCTPGTDCAGIRAIVVSIMEPAFDTIPDGTVLYTCKVEVAAGGNPDSAERDLVCPSGDADPPFEAAQSSTPPPPVLNNTTCVDNQVRICDGDCNLDRQVFVNEVTIGFQILAGNQPVTNCLSADANNDGEVFVNEVTLAFNRLANGCPGQ